MAKLPFFRRTFRITRFQPDVPRDIAEEIELHLDLRTEELIEQGLAPEEARLQAEAAFGDRQGIEHACRRIDEPIVRKRLRAEILASLLGDIRRACRDLLRRPAFALAACLTLAVCIALNTAVFSVVHSIILAPLPLPEPDRLVRLFNSYPKAGFPRAGNTAPEYFERRQAVTAFEEVGLYQIQTYAMGEPGAMRRVFGMNVTPSFFRALKVEPHLGRNFTEDEMEPAGGSKTIIDFGLWQELFAGDPSAIGQDLRIRGAPYTVVGVMPEGFNFPSWSARLWLPLTFTDEQKSDQGRFDPYYQMLARLRPEATIIQAKSQLDAWNEGLIDRVPAGYAALIEEAGGFDTRIVDFHDDLVRHVEPWLFLLWGGALFVLLIGGVSLTNLLLVRSIGRAQELATRHVLGAGRVRLARQLFTESLVLAIIGGGLGILAGAWSLRLVDVFENYQLPRVGEVGLDPRAAALILLLAIAVMAGSSVVTALATHRRDLFAILRSGASTFGRGPLRLRGALAAAQIAIACILLIGAALMSASLFNLLSIDPGFDARGVLTGAVSLPGPRFEDRAEQHRFYDAALADVRGLPGVTGVALSSQLPFDDLGERGMLTAEGLPRQPGDELLAHTQTVISPDFFQILQIPLLAGRPFDPRDDINSLPVAIVSEDVANRYWQGVDEALGKRVFLGPDPYVGIEPGADAEWLTVVGVVGEIVQDDLTDRSSRRGAYYLPYRQSSRTFARIAIKTDSPSLALVPSLRECIVALDPEIVLFWVTTLEDNATSSLIRFRIPMQLLLIFAAVALLLAAIGVYSVLAQSVAQRAREIGIRMALGSSLEQIYRWVFSNVLILVASGLVLGLAGALSLTHLMTSLLYEVRPTDPAVFVAAGIVIGIVALLAATIPARRATRINPVEVLTPE